MREISLYNECHLGDHIFCMIFLSQIQKYMEENDIHIHYYCLNQYHEQVREFVSSKHIHLFDYHHPIGINAWIGDQRKKINYFHVYSQIKGSLRTPFILSNRIDFHSFLPAFHTQLLQEMNIPLHPLTLCLEDPDLWIRYENLPRNIKT